MAVNRKHPMTAHRLAADRRPGRRTTAHARLCVGFFAALGLSGITGCGAAWMNAGRPASAVRADAATLDLDALAPALTKPVSPAQPLALPDPAAELVAAAERLLADRKPADALASLKGIDPALADHPRVVRLYGLAYAGMSRQDLALDYLTRSASANPDDLDVQFAIGQAYAAAGNRQSGILALRRALLCGEASADSPTAAEALLWLSDLLAKEGYYTAALQCLTRLGEQIETHGRELMANRAVAALVLGPEHLLTARAELLSKLARCGEAAELLQAALRYDRSQPRPAMMLTEALVSSGQFKQAESFLVEIAAEPAQQAQLPRLAEDVCLRSGDADMPGRLAGELVSRKLLDGQTAVALAKAAKKLNRPDDAERILGLVLAAHPGNADVARVLAGLAAAKGMHNEALFGLARMLSENPNAAKAAADGIDEVIATETPADLEHTFAGLAERGNLPKGVAPFAAYFVAGRLAEAYHDRMLAAELYYKATSGDKLFPPAYESLAAIYIQSGQDARLQRLLDRASAVAPDSYLPGYLRGMSLLASGKYWQAAEQLAAARKRGPDHLPTLILLGETLMRLGRFEEAESTLGEAVRLQGKPGGVGNERAYKLLFDIYMAGRAYSRAGALVDLLDRREGQNQTALVLRTRLALGTGQLDAAKEGLVKLRSDYPDDTDQADLIEVQIALANGDQPLPQADIKRLAGRLAGILLRDPEDFAARLTLLNLMARQGEDGRDYAVEVWADLYDQTGGHPGIARSYAAALFRAERFAESADLLEKMLADDPRDLASRRVLLKALDKLGDRRRLIEQYDAGQKALDEWIASLGDDGQADALRREKLSLYLQAGMYDQYADFVRTWLARSEAPNAPGRQMRGDSSRSQPTPDSKALKGLAIRELTEAKRPDLVHQLLDEWIALGDADADAYRRAKLSVYIDGEQFEDARRFALAWSASQPGRILPRMAAVAELLASERYDQAQDLVDYWAEQSLANPVIGEAEVPAATRPASRAATESAVEPTSEAAAQAMTRSAPVRCSTTQATSRAATLAAAEPAAVPASRPPAHAMPQSGTMPTMPTTAALSASQKANQSASRPASRPATRPATQPATQPVAAEEQIDPAGAGRWARHWAVRLLLIRQKFPDALERAERYERVDPDSGELLMLKSTALSELERPGEALAVMESAYRLNQEEPSVNNNLAYLYAQDGAKLDQAERMVRRALAEMPDETSFLDTLGWVFYKQGRIVEAGRIFDRVLGEAPGGQKQDPVICDHAADTMWRLDKKQRAMDLWRKAIELEGKKANPLLEDRRMLAGATGKLQAAEAGEEPAVAPLAEEESQVESAPIVTEP